MSKFIFFMALFMIGAVSVIIYLICNTYIEFKILERYIEAKTKFFEERCPIVCEQHGYNFRRASNDCICYEEKCLNNMCWNETIRIGIIIPAEITDILNN